MRKIIRVRQTITEDKSSKQLVWFEHVQRMQGDSKNNVGSKTKRKVEKKTFPGAKKISFQDLRFLKAVKAREGSASWGGGGVASGIVRDMTYLIRRR